MATEVHLILTGILAVQRWKEGTASNQWRIVVPQVKGHSRHFPTLMVEEGSIVSGNANHTKSFTGNGGRTIDLAWWDLAGETIQIRSSVSPGGAANVPARAIEMNQACQQPGCHQLDNAGPGKYTTAAMMIVPGARLDATFTDLGIDWKFQRAGNAKPKGHVAEELCLEFSIAESTLELQIGSETIELQPQHGRIEVRLSNLTENQIVPSCREDPALVDPHFRFYYEMSKNTNANDLADLRGTRTSGSDDPKHDHRLTLLPDQKCPPRPRAMSPAGANCPPSVWDDGP